MKPPDRFRWAVAMLVAMGLIVGLLGEPGAAAPRPRPKPAPKIGPKPGPKPGLKPGPKPGAKPPVVKPLVKRPVVVAPRVVPRRAARVVVPAVLGPRLVVRSAGGVVVHETAPAVVISSADELAVVPPPEAAPQAAYKVAEVADDYLVTLLIDGRETPVRLLGVEPPLVAETENDPGRLPDSARDFARNLLVDEFVSLEHDASLAERDADGNLVGYLYRAPDGLLVNLELVRQGYGLAATDYAFAHAEAFAAYQEKAQADGKGIWRLVAGGSP